MESCEFDKLFTKTRPHIFEMICLSLDYETFKNCLRVNRAWSGVLTNKILQPKVKSVFREEMQDEEDTLLNMSEEGDTEGVRRILSSGLVNVDCEIGGHETPLIRASTMGHRDIVQLLLNAGADVNQEIRYKKCMAKSPLMMAAFYNHKDVVKLLIDAGAETDKADNLGMTPLHRAVWQNGVEVVKLLLDNGADVNKAIDDDAGITPLIYAAFYGYYDVAKLLIDRGARVEKASNEGETPLITAVGQNKKEVVKLLLDSGASVTDGGGAWTPFGVALEMGKSHEEVLGLLFNAWKVRSGSKLTLEEFLAKIDDSD